MTKETPKRYDAMSRNATWGAGQAALAVCLCAGVILLAAPARAAITVDIAAPGGTVQQTLPDEGGAFAVDMPLGKNMVNNVLVSASDTLGNTAEQRVSITQVSLADVVISEFTSEPLSPERIEQLVNDGVIDLEDPENYNVSEFTIVLTIDKRPVPVSLPIVTPKDPEEPNGFEVYRFPFGDDSGGAHHTPRPVEIIVFEKPIPSEPGQPAPPPIPGVFVIDGRIKSLKEFFSCRLILMNASGVFVLSDVVAELEFPGGGLTNILPADGIASFGDILPGEGGRPGQVEKEFIIRGDEKGERPVGVKFGGFVTGPGIPEDAPIPFNGSASTTVEVKGPPTFQVQVFHPDSVMAGEPYDMRVDITNTGELPALYASLEIDVAGAGQLLECDFDSEALKADCAPVDGPAVRKLGHVLPGQTVSETFTVNPFESGFISSCVAASDQNIALQVYVGNLGCLAGHYPPVENTPDGAPTVRVLPAPNTLSVGLDTPVAAFFSTVMDHNSITTGETGTFNVYDEAGALLPGDLSFDTLGEGTERERTLAIWQYHSQTSAKLPANSTLTVVLTQGIQDLNGRALAAEYVSTFTTTGEGLEDNDPPLLTLSIEPPVDPNLVLPGERVRVNAYAADQGTGVARVEARIKDLDEPAAQFTLIDQKRVAAGDMPPFIFTLDSANLAFGHAYELRATAYDFAGNVQDATIGLVVADTADPPTIALPDDPAAPWLQGISLNVTPVSLTGAVREVAFYLDGAAEPFKTATLRPYEAYARTLELPLGAHTVRAVATDGLGQTGEDTLAFEMVENINMPMVSFGSAVDGSKFVLGTVFPLKITVEDPVGIASVEAFLGGAKSDPITTGTQTFLIDTTALGLGTHTVTVVATNRLGITNDPAAPDSVFEFVVVEPPPGQPPAAPSVTGVSFVANGQTTVTGTTVPGARVDAVNTMLGVSVSVYADSTGAFQVVIASDEGNTVTLVAYDFSQSPGPSEPTTITVPVRPVLDRIEVEPGVIAFTSFDAYRDLTVTAYYQDGSSSNVTGNAAFASEMPGVARVSASGRVAPVANGIATITATFEGMTDAAQVTVSVVTLDYITVEPSPITLIAVGQTQSLSVIGHYSDGASQALTTGIAYVSGNRDVARVNAAGLVTAMANGNTQVTVSVSGLQPVVVPISVNTGSDPAPTVTILSPADGAEVERGQTVNVSVRAQDAAGGVSLVHLAATGATIYSLTKQISPPELNTVQSFTFQVDAAAPVGGEVMVSAYAEDTSAQPSASAQITLHVADKTAPEAVITAPAPQTEYNFGDTIAIAVTASDAVGVSRIRCVMTGGLERTGTRTFDPALTSATATFNVPVPYGLSDPDVRIVAYALDTAGNEGVSAAVDVVVTDADIVPPETIATAVSNPGSGSTATVTYQVVSGLADLDHVELFFRRDGYGTFNRYTAAATGNPEGHFTPQSGAVGTIPFDSTRMGGDGHFEFYTVGVDIAGNRESAPQDGAKAVDADQEVDISAGTVWGTLSTDTLIDIGDSAYEDRNLRVDGAAVTVNGHHAFHNVELVNGARLTHPETDLTTEYGLDIAAWTITVDDTSAVEADSRGYLGGNRNGNGSSGRTLGNVEGSSFRSAGSHAGIGAAREGTANPAYGNLVTPGDLGSGGSRGYYGEAGGDGGGRVQLQAINLVNDGRVSANGGNGAGSDAGSGSGGSVYLVVSTVSGLGAVSANGGANQLGGGGGRVAVHYVDMSTLDAGLVRAVGGQGASGDGGNGTVFLKGSGEGSGTLVVDGQGVASAFTALPIPPGYVFDSIVLRNSARVVADDILEVNDTLSVLTGSILTHSVSGEEGLRIEADHVFVDDTSLIDVSSRGYRGGRNSGNPESHGLTLDNQPGAQFRSAGSYGGYGANHDAAQGSLPYGHPNAPIHLGSGGSRGYYGEAGGNGGGRVSIAARKSVEVNGAIRADGGAGGGSHAGSGSGGSIWIETSQIKGYGAISADGGDGQVSGGGGRIAIQYDYLGVPGNDFDDLRAITAMSGRGTVNQGSAGTVLLWRSDQAYGDLYVDDGWTDAQGVPSGPAPAFTPLTPITFGAIIEISEDTIMTDGLVRLLPGGLAGIEINPNINQDQTYLIVDNTENAIIVDTTGKPSLTSVAAAGDTCVGVYRFDNVYFRRGGALVTGDRVVVQDTMLLDEYGTLTHFDATTNREFHLDITVGNLAIRTTGAIDTDDRGYLGGNHNGTGSAGQTVGNTEGATFRAAASHGGLGAPGDGTPNPIYGNLTTPADLGSGGSRGYYGEQGGDGGGHIRILADTITVEGAISADGGPGRGSNAGSGSGGTIHISASTLSGTGSIRANGGASQLGGGGGRIAVYYDELTLDEAHLEALGGQGSVGRGGNGTVFLKAAFQSLGTLVIDGSGLDTPGASTRIPGGYTFNNITLRNNARVVADEPLVLSNTLRVLTGSVLTHSVEHENGLRIEAYRVIVDADSSIDVSSKGYRGGNRDGNAASNGLTLGGLTGATFRSAGSFGGLGARHDGVPNTVYGHPADAVYLGSGGSRGYYGELGGNGGGLVSIVAQQEVQVLGAIRADGGNGGGSHAGSGSGGSVAIATALLHGTGAIAANGGAYELGGGGGRIVVDYTTLGAPGDDFDGLRAITAFGGAASRPGSAGTVLFRHDGLADGDLYIDAGMTDATDSVETPLTLVGFGRIIDLTSDTITTNGVVAMLPNGLVGIEINPNTLQAETYTVVSNTDTTITVDIAAKAPLTSVAAIGDAYSGVFRFDNLVFRRGGYLMAGDKLVINDTALIDENGVLTHYEATTGFESRLDLSAGTVHVTATGAIDAFARGYLGGNHNGAGSSGRTLGNVDGATFRSAGSYGGLGGANEGTPNPVYGSETSPAALGSGGSRGYYGEVGGDGGGWIAIDCNAIVVDGRVSADGEAGHGSYAGSGSGGSVHVVTTSVSGTGAITANGGGNQLGGGGGRVALHYTAASSDLTSLATTASGGVASPASGGDGSVLRHAVP